MMDGQEYADWLYKVAGDALADGPDRSASLYWRCGDRIHKITCRYARSRTAGAWRFADGLDQAEVQAIVMNTPWLDLCRVCGSEEERLFG